METVAESNTRKPFSINGIQLPETPGLENFRSSVTDYHVSYEEALRVIKRIPRRAVYVRVNQFAASRCQEGVPADSTRGRDIYGLVKVTRGEALRFLDNAYSARSREECYVRLAVSDACLFVG